MKVIQYYESFLPRLGGVETYISNVINNMSDISFEVVTPRFSKMESKESLSHNCTVKRFDPVKTPKKNSSILISRLDTINCISKDLIRQKRINKYLSNADYDLLHSHAPCHQFPMFRWDKKIFNKYFLSKSLIIKSKKPKLLTIHHLYFGSLDYKFENDTFKNGYFKNLIENADRVIVVENYSYDYLKYYLEKFRYSQRLYKIHNCVDTNIFGYKENNLEKNLKVLFVGRLTSEKGINQLCEFIKKLPNFIDFSIVTLGDGEEFRIINNLAKSRKNISLFKNISFEKLIQLYQKSNILWNPVLFEAITRVTLEAMSCGRPVIMVDKGNRDPVVNGKTGFLINDNVDELISLLTYLNDNKEGLIKIGKNTRKIIEHDYSNSAVLPKIKNIYKSMN